jgi:hypothetical protein
MVMGAQGPFRRFIENPFLEEWVRRVRPLFSYIGIKIIPEFPTFFNVSAIY